MNRKITFFALAGKCATLGSRGFVVGAIGSAPKAAVRQQRGQSDRTDTRRALTKKMPSR